MPNKLRRTLRYTRRTLGYGMLVLLILAALAVSIASLLLPFIEDNPQRVKAWLEEQVGQPVDFDRSQTEWSRRGPRVRLTGLRVGRGAAQVEIAQAELLVSVYSGLFPNHPLTELKVRNLHLRLVQNADDSWQLLGLPRQADAKQDVLDVLSGFGELQLQDSDLRFEPRKRDAVLIPRIDLRLRVRDSRLNVGIRAQSRRDDPPVYAVIELERPAMTGKLWIGGKHLHAERWLGLFPDIRLAGTRSEAELDLWADIEKRRVMRAHGKLKIADLRRSGEERADRENRSVFDSVQGEWRWQRTATGWSSQIPEIAFRSGSDLQLIRDVRVSQANGRWRAQAAILDILPLSRLASLDAGKPGDGAWFGQSDLHGRLYGMRAYGNAARSQWHIAGKSEKLGFSPVGNAPGLDGLGGPFIADQQGGVLRLNAPAGVLNWPVSFGKPIGSRFDGAVSWWRNGPDWESGTHGFRWQGDGLDMEMDAQMRFPADAGAPELNLAATLEPFGFTTAKRFWLQHLMPKATVDWLNMALVKGQVRDASVLVAGNLGHWPFDDRTGRFSAKATVLADTLKFAEDWPAADNAVLLADFNGPGFSAVGHTGFLGNRIALKPSGIASFNDSELIIDVHADSDFARLMPVLRQTPLKSTVGTTVTALQGSGPVSTDVRMLFALAKGPAHNDIGGTIDFKGTAMRMPEWNLAMQSVTGGARFDNDGFVTEGLLGRIARQPVRLDLRVGSGHVRNKANQVESEISGAFHTDTLWAFDPSLSDLRSVLKGQSDWRFTVTVPASRSNAGVPVQLSAVSDLSGTAIALPVPLRKSPAEVRTFSLNTLLPLGLGPVDIRIGPDFRLLLEKPKDKPIAAVALFGRQTQGAIPSAGISARGTTAEFDVPGWLALAKKAEGGGGLQSLDLTIENFRLAGGVFDAVRLQRMPVKGAMAIRASGRELDGMLSLPDAGDAPITGRFSTVHFGMPKPLPAAPAVDQTAVDFGDPGDLPPIDLQIEDLRVGKMAFGRVELLTAPSAGGMAIKRLSSQSPVLAVNASGAWQGTAAQSGTSLRAQITSPDLGRFLDASGYVDVFDRGSANAKLLGAWPGSPLDFNLRNFSGTLDVDIRNGQIPGIKAGGGRILGLLSIAEIKRRLSMDFSDFTGEGLGFNSIQGQFRFAQGKATTQNTVLKAPSADIVFTGSTDLVREQFDQTITVQPNTGGFLPVIGAVAGGPIGAAAGLVAQAALGKGLQKGITLKYRITGPWSKPDVQKLQEAGRKVPDAGKAPDKASPPD